LTNTIGSDIMNSEG